MLLEVLSSDESTVQYSFELLSQDLWCHVVEGGYEEECTVLVLPLPYLGQVSVDTGITLSCSRSHAPLVTDWFT